MSVGPEREQEIRRQIAVLESKAGQSGEPLVRKALTERISQLRNELGETSVDQVPTLDVPAAAALHGARAYYVLVDGKQKGPLTQEAVMAMLESKLIGPESGIWGAGMERWQPISSVPELNIAPTIAPPTTPATVDIPTEHVYYVRVGEISRGPLNREGVAALLASGEVLPSSEAWGTGMEQWQPISTFEELSAPTLIAKVVDQQPVTPSPSAPKDEVTAARAEAAAAASTKKRRLEDDIVLPTPATPEQRRQADDLLRQAKAAKVRHQDAEASRLLAQAVQVAPGSPDVLEALGDDFTEQRKTGDARLAYFKAFKMDPKNVRLERKYAETVFTASGYGYEMKALQEADVAATAKWATVLSVILPGAGQLAMFQWWKGGVMMAIALAAAAYLLPSLHVGAKAEHFNAIFWVTLGIYALLWLISVFDCAAQAKRGGDMGSIGGPGSGAGGVGPKAVERPVPPVDLPFE